VRRSCGRSAAAGDSGVGELRGDIQLDYVPGLSERRVTFVFPERPHSSGLELRIVAFTTP